MRKSSAFVAHSGGPTAVLNMSLLGVVQEARRGRIPHLWAGRWGLGGVLRDNVVDLLKVPQTSLFHMAYAPGSFVGSYRGPMTDENIEQILDFFRKREIRYCLYTGGNGSMGTLLRIQRLASHSGYELHALGIPKTVDNDIRHTDHCPGFPSAARFAAMAVRDAGFDQRALPTPVSIFEVMGRNTGWLAAATILARRRPDDPPHFIYTPERPLDERSFLDVLDRTLQRLGWALGVVSEGLRSKSGKMIGGSAGHSRDARGRPLPGNTAQYLAQLASKSLKIRARSEKPGLLCRSFSPCTSAVDARESYQIGCFAVRSALDGHIGMMVKLKRSEGRHYRCLLDLVPLELVAEHERTLPLGYLGTHGTVRESFRDYIAPLAGEIAIAPVLEEILKRRD
ncbi:MAG: diphosphate--fructose-6-phosphate 1-phosphotransferase [Terriglobia bacterium]